MMIKINPSSRGLSKWKHLFMPSMSLAFKAVVWKKAKDIAWFFFPSLWLTPTTWGGGPLMSLICSIAGGQSDGVVILADQLCVLSAIYSFCKGSFGRT